ncbi:MAG: UPF0175 family protein [Verrucomicrobia bacterium]|nr:UPF0175 family protein [Verrucomicrobiota bacterium]
MSPALCEVSRVMQVTVKMPDQIARQWGETPDEVARHVMEDAAIEGYRAGRLSHRQVGQMLGLDYWQTEAFLKERGVPLRTWKLTTRRWKESWPNRERRRLGHLAVALPHPVWRRSCAASPLQPS